MALICPDCGAKNIDGVDMCESCGQSLTMLNDPFVIDQATKWSQHLMTLKLNPRQRIRFMFRRAFGREPSAAELQSTQNYVADLTTEHADSEDEKVRQERVWRDLRVSTSATRLLL